MGYINVYYKKNILHEIVLPKSIITWVLNHIDSPISGYEHKSCENGEYMTVKEQIAETQYQLFVIASDYFRRGASEEKIIDVLSRFHKQSS